MHNYIGRGGIPASTLEISGCCLTAWPSTLAWTDEQLEGVIFYPSLCRLARKLTIIILFRSSGGIPLLTPICPFGKQRVIV